MRPPGRVTDSAERMLSALPTQSMVTSAPPVRRMFAPDPPVPGCCAPAGWGLTIRVETVRRTARASSAGSHSTVDPLVRGLSSRARVFWWAYFAATTR